MAYACDICAKGKQYGHNVSFSQRKTQKVWKPNLQRQYLDLGTSRIQVKICTQCLRTLKKYKAAETVPTPADTAKAKSEAKAAVVKSEPTPAAKTVAKKAPTKKAAAAK